MTIRTRLLLLALVACVAEVAGAGGASAKSELPSKAIVSGPGISGSIVITRKGALTTLLTHGGFFQAVVREDVRPMLPGRPAGRRGPHYVIRYIVPRWRWRPGRVRTAIRTAIIRQDIYPYAEGGAITYMQPRQPIFNSFTRGGWFRGGVALKNALLRDGLPGEDAGKSWLRKDLDITAPLLAVLLGAAATLIVRRMRRRTAASRARRPPSGDVTPAR